MSDLYPLGEQLLPDQRSGLLCVEPCTSFLIGSIPCSPHCAGTQTAFLCFCLGVLPSGWTDRCLRVLPGFKWTGMWCLLKLLFSFSQNTHNVGDGRGLASFFSLSVFNEGPHRVVTWFEGETADDDSPFLWLNLWWEHFKPGGSGFW